jgi:hypothetical protein
MGSIINVSGRRISCHRHEKHRKQNPNLIDYHNRNQELRMVGWEDYKKYLESDIWKRIREREFKCARVCEICRGSATQLHHWSYEIEVMMGSIPEHLIPLCRNCHERIEFGANAEKLSLPNANRKLHGLSFRPSKLWTKISRGWKKIETLKRKSIENDSARTEIRKFRKKFDRRRKGKNDDLYTIA